MTIKINTLIVCSVCLLLLAPLVNCAAKATPSSTITEQLDSLNQKLSLEISKSERLETLHKACEVLYKEDLDRNKLISYAKEGIEIAKKINNVNKGSDLAVWILRANIYLRNYNDNPPYYQYLKELFTKGEIKRQKYIQPLYTEIYSYIDYGKFKAAEKMMVEFEQLIDKENPKQLIYYLDIFIRFKIKAKEYKDASVALEQFVDESRKNSDDKRFLFYALARNAGFFLDDSINYRRAQEYAFKALEVAEEANLNTLKDHVLLQLSKAYYHQHEYDNFEFYFYQINADSIVSDKILLKDYNTFSGDIHFDKEEYKEAIKDYMSSVQLLENSDFISMEQLTKKIEKCHVKQNNYQQAYKFANRLNVLQDSLNTEANLKAIEDFKSKLKQKDDETERLKLQSKIHSQKKSTIFIGFFSSLLMLSLLFYNRILDEKVKTRTAALNNKNKELKSNLIEMEQFSYIASHDIKEPMRVVSSITGLIQKKLTKVGAENTYESEFNLVNSSINQLYSLIEDLSEFINFKSTKVTHQLVDTNILLKNISNMLSAKTVEVNGQIIFEDLPKIYTSSSLMTVIFKNLIENGIKYNESAQPQVTINYEQASNSHLFHITDNGIGIDAQYYDYIFQMFKRLKSGSNKGSGLGLGLVKKSIEKLEGSIALRSVIGEGSVFTITLPKNYITQQ